MRDLVIEGTDHTPNIHFKPTEGTFEIKGESRPENARQFFHPIVEWIEDFSHYTVYNKEKAPKPYRFNFKLEYMNSISTKLIYDLLKKLEEIPNTSIIINWYYQEDDIDMQENGEEYSRMVKLKFEFHPIRE
ncbi:MAG: DUF1987 domain-containing protein [Bacteroidia bacterium]|nr:DUF1987 domain-containing protein [Bacteroidia bacterium]